MTDTPSQADLELHERIRLDTETIAWKDLAVFYAKGKVIAVHPQLNLAEVAFQISKDNKELVDDLMQRRLMQLMPDHTAQEWFDSNAIVRASVVSPFVLVQKVSSQPT
ncbi:MAG: DUF2288 family protein [Deltaproteobacteria bacterium]|nr:DUF2288 family protein [Deltaproteobacteria bacterium]